MIDDLSKGRVPNVYAEMGGPAELRHNPVGAAKKALIVTAVVTIGYLFLARHKPQRPAVRLGNTPRKHGRLIR